MLEEFREEDTAGRGREVEGRRMREVEGGWILCMENHMYVYIRTLWRKRIWRGEGRGKEE